jgi:uncharacterized membrane protein
MVASHHHMPRHFVRLLHSSHSVLTRHPQLVLHPVAAALTFLTLPALLWALRRPRRLAPLVSLFSTFITLIAYIIDLALFVPAHMRLNGSNAQETLGQAVMDVRYGAAFWLALVATVCSVLASLGVCAAHRVRRREGDWTYESQQIITSSDRPPSRSLVDEKAGHGRRGRRRAEQHKLD